MAVKKEKMPSREWCFQLLHEWEVPENVIAHTLQVNRIAVYLAKKLEAVGVDIDVELVDRASLLHDLDKMRTLQTHNHGFVTKEHLTQLGYPLLGETIRQHRFNAIHEKQMPLEGKLVSYADKRVNYSDIVSLDERFDYLIKRYDVKNIDYEAHKIFKSFEQEIFSKIGQDPLNIEEDMDKEGFPSAAPQEGFGAGAGAYSDGKVKAIVFDLWNTLAYNSGPNPVVDMQKRYNISDIKLMEKAIEMQTFESLEEMMFAFAKFFSLPDDEASIAAMSRRFKEGVKNTRLFDDVVPELTLLKKNYMLGLVSNTDSYAIGWLSQFGLLPLFAEANLSCEVGIIKPDKEIFRLMLKKLNLRPEQVVMVGDNVSDDMMPAKELGMKAILIKRDGNKFTSHIEKGIYNDSITKLSELEPIMRKKGWI